MPKIQILKLMFHWYKGTSFPVLYFLSCLILFSFSLSAQTTTRSTDESSDKMKSPVRKTKVLIIPFDSKMYLSDIDRSINRETKMKFEQIRDVIRYGIDKELSIQFKTTYSVISLLRDTAKTNKDLKYIYHSIGYKFTPAQGKEKAASQTPVTKGELTVPSQDDEEKFMRTIINLPGLLTAMNKKYGAELFVFISEVDLKSAGTENEQEREAIVHYTIFDLQGNQIAGGLSKFKFPVTMNDPKKIVSFAFPPISKIIFSKSIIKADTPLIPPK